MSGRKPPPREVPPPDGGERRRNQPLRELLDELVILVRALARQSASMTPAELEYAQERLQWLADEIWSSATNPPEE